jgi:hypothetical protein
VPCADPDAFLNLLDCLVNDMDRICPMPSLVMRGLAQLGAGVPQSLERPFHVTLISGSVLNQRNNRERWGENLKGESGFHEAVENATITCARARKKPDEKGFGPRTSAQEISKIRRVLDRRD